MESAGSQPAQWSSELDGWVIYFNDQLSLVRQMTGRDRAEREESIKRLLQPYIDLITPLFPVGLEMDEWNYAGGYRFLKGDLEVCEKLALTLQAHGWAMLKNTSVEFRACQT